jgi:hypothetical protein
MIYRRCRPRESGDDMQIEIDRSPSATTVISRCVRSISVRM